jgi:hypothetical protein
MSDHCIEPGCDAPGIVGVNGKWACREHLDKHMATLKAELRAAKPKRWRVYEADEGECA